MPRNPLLPWSEGDPTVNARAEAIRLLKQAPFVRQLRRWRYHQIFARTRVWANLHWGTFASFDEAMKAAPATLHAGYREAPDRYRHKLDALEPSDYPVLFWMGKLLGEARSVVDLGGNVGVTYHAFRRYLRYPEELRWTVVDLPAVLAEGRSVASSRPSGGLQFAAALREVEHSEIFLASGSLQFIAGTMADHLAQLRERPTHLVLNKLPLHEGATVVTLQNTGDSFAPCWLYNARELISSIEALGYELVDRWSCADRSLYVPFDERSVPAFSGLYFRERARQ